MKGDVKCTTCGTQLHDPPSREIQGRTQVECHACGVEFFPDEDMLDMHYRRLP